MRVTLPLLRIPAERAPILRYGVAVLSTALALIPTVMLADVSESRLALFGVAVMVSAWYGGWKPGIVATAFALAFATAISEPGLEIRDVFDRVEAMVDHAPNHQQRPWIAYSAIWFMVALSAVLPQLLNKQPQAEAEVVEPLPVPSAFEPIGARRL